MHFVRTMLLVLLALNLPGWAFAAMPSCSMEAGSMQHAGAAAADQHASMADAGKAPCCADGQATGDQAGSTCADGAHCQCGTLYQAVQPVVAAVTPAAAGVDQIPLFHAITASTLPLWRPPTLS